MRFEPYGHFRWDYELFFSYKTHRHKCSDGRAVVFEQRDLEFLYLLLIFRCLSLYQINYYAKAKGMKSGTLKSKLTRWREKKIVASEPYTDKRVYYSLDSEGIAVLKNLGFIKQGDDLFIEPPTAFMNHYFGIRDCVLLTLLELWKQEKQQLELISPMTQPYKLKNAPDGSSYLIPDWIIKYPRGTINFEVDNATENSAAFKNKIEKYVAYAKEHPDENYQVIVAVIDGSDENLKYFNLPFINRSRRVANLKQAIIEIYAHQEDNLHFYVVPIGRTGKIASEIIQGNYLPSDKEREVSELLKDIGVEFTSLIANDFYLADMNVALQADKHIALWIEDEKKICFLKLMEEGNIRHLDEIRYLNQLMLEKRFKRDVDYVIGIYRTDDEQRNDVLLGDVLDCVHIISKTSWSQSPFNPKALLNAGTGSKRLLKEVSLYGE